MAAIDNIGFQIRDFARRVPQKRSRSACAACWFVRGLFVAGLVFWLILAAFALWSYLPEAGTVLDYLSPTAVQARDAGWVALSEGSR
ncbi:hypothetical protein pthi1_p10 [Paracoccus phage vB_PthS_Pthi1]|uniref:Uncharacterized protein n=1 Tax=Paracoccus thiocyanatus TaxID=34006 RepID=A0A1N6SGZ7_9RHOB|nr:hypothetical protein [Paracoccus thiocyanatus]AZV00375.1 hypothetical protein pthi1_p10 [Paracoccus phage vB_PthS_Pthi1]SIQ40289.1 hypothetical protein SAMN05421641_107107 [Paracoccus thiocyanatus]